MTPMRRSLFWLMPVCSSTCTVMVLSTLFRMIWKLLLPVQLGATELQNGTLIQLKMVVSGASYTQHWPTLPAPKKLRSAVSAAM